jgi:hypothetical protein
MCLSIYVRSKAELMQPKIATKDIKVYKVLQLLKVSGGYISPYRNMAYEPGTHYYQHDKKKKQPFLLITSLYFLKKYRIETGLHAFINKKAAKTELDYQFNKSPIIIEMIVPKGAKYYRNKTEIVSTDLIFPHEFKIIN